MENKQPLLSICIPTYNRGDILKENLNYILKLPEFDDSIEIVISDNASTDNTEEVAKSFTSFYKNIRYYKNETNVRDANFELAMNRGNGVYIKLMNDRLTLTNEGLGYIKSKVQAHILDKRPIFFTNDYIYTKNKAEIIECNSLDEYVQSISTYVTLIGIFGAWKEHWESVENKNQYKDLLLSQDDWCYQIVDRYNGCVIYDRHIMVDTNVQIGIRSGYNCFEVHLDNYYKILTPYIESGKVSHQTIKQDKKYLLKHFIPELLIIFIYVKKPEFFKYDTSNTLSYFYKYYKKEYYFYLILFLYPFWYVMFNSLLLMKIIVKKSLILFNNKKYKETI